ncbi:MAG: DUF3039 domain-containing protein [Actinomycetota bacterium]|nr:DUF3039 domain-containing protein [Actinomycetota bacterium]
MNRGRRRVGKNGRVTDTSLETTPDLRFDDGDHDRFAHYVRKSDIMRSAVEGVAVEALCGKRWVPNRDPERYPVCPECKAIYEAIKAAKN